MAPTTLWNKNFLLLWLGQAQSACGNTFYIVALTYIIIDLTGSPKYTALTMAAGTIPFVFSPLIGAIIDRTNMKPILILGDLIRGLCMFLICTLLMLKQLTISVVIISAFVTGWVGLIYRPTFASLLPRLVPQADIARANALNALSGQLSTLNGFMFGGMLVAFIGAGYAILFNGITFVIMSLLLLFIQFPQMVKSSKTKKIWADVKEGFHYLFSSRSLLLIPIIFFVMGASYAPLEILMPVKLKTMNYGPEGFGIFFSSFLIGSILTSTLISKYGQNWSTRLFTLVGLIIMTVMMSGIAFVTTFVYCCICSFFYGVGSSLVSISSITYVQTTVIDQFRGRIFSLFGIIEQACMPIALAIIAKLTEIVTTESILYLTSFTLMLTTMIWFVHHRRSVVQSTLPFSE